MSHVWRRFTGWLMVAATLAGCVSITGAGMDRPPPFRLLTLSVSGGVAGVDRVVRVEGSGRVLVQDRRRGLCVRGRMTAAEVEELAALAEQVEFDRKNPPSDVFRQRCYDCMNYALSLTGTQGEVRRVTWTAQARPLQGPVRMLAERLAGWLTKLESVGAERDCRRD